MTRLATLALAALALAGCRGPKGSPESTVKSFYSAADAQDFESMADCLSSASLSRIGSPARAAAYFQANFTGWRDFSITIDDWSIGADEKTATVRFVCVADSVTNYKHQPVDCSDTYSLVKEDDGKWHINFASKLRTQ